MIAVDARDTVPADPPVDLVREDAGGPWSERMPPILEEPDEDDGDRHTVYLVDGAPVYGVTL